VHPEILRAGVASVSWQEFKERYRQMCVDPATHTDDFQHRFEGWPPAVDIQLGGRSDLSHDRQWASCVRRAWRLPLFDDMHKTNGGLWHEAWDSWPTEPGVAKEAFQPP
jgi:hypothetical protein